MRLLLLPAALFLANALIYIAFYARLPEISQGLGLSADRLGLALFGQTAGTFMGFCVAPAVVERFGTFRVSGICMAIMAWAMCWAVTGGFDHGLLGLGLACGIFGMAAAMFEVAKNMIAVRIEQANDVRILARCHGFWSVGLIVGSLLVGLMTRLGVGPMPVQIGVALALMPLCAYMLSRSEPLRPAVAVVATPVKVARAQLFARPDRFVIALLILVIGFGVTEGAVYDWAMFYLKDAELALPEGVPALIYAAFAGGMAVARMFGDVVRDRLPLVAMIRAMALVTLTGLVLAGLGGVLPGAFRVPVLLLGFAAIGMGVALGSPVASGIALSRKDRDPAQTMSAYALIAMMALFCLPPTLGVVVERVGALWALMFGVPVIVVAAAAARRLVRALRPAAPVTPAPLAGAA